MTSRRPLGIVDVPNDALGIVDVPNDAQRRAGPKAKGPEELPDEF
jgi:hypothetical protein